MATTASVRLNDNESITCSPKFGSINQKVSKSGSGYWYTMDTEEGRINLNPSGAKAVQEGWCGKGGTMKISKMAWDDWKVEVVEAADQIYPLEMKTWKDNTMQTVPFIIPGFPTDPDAETPPAAEPAAEPVAPATPPADASKWTLDDLANLMMWATQRAGACIETMQPEKEIGQGDYIGALERMAVSLFIEAKKQNLRSAEVSVQKVLEVFDGELVQKAPGLTEYRTV